jgi:hypothetical protein
MSASSLILGNSISLPLFQSPLQVTLLRETLPTRRLQKEDYTNSISMEPPRGIWDPQDMEKPFETTKERSSTSLPRTWVLTPTMQ